MSLTLKQQRFVLQYMVDLNATQAAKRVVYKAKTAGAKAAPKAVRSVVTNWPGKMIRGW